MLEAAKVCVHDIQGHLHSVEAELVIGGDFQHAQMNQRIFMPGKSDVANLAGLFCGLDCFHRSAFGEDAIRIFHPDDFVELHQVDAIGLQPFQGLVDL